MVSKQDSKTQKSEVDETIFTVNQQWHRYSAHLTIYAGRRSRRCATREKEKTDTKVRTGGVLLRLSFSWIEALTVTIVSCLLEMAGWIAGLALENKLIWQLNYYLFHCWYLYLFSAVLKELHCQLYSSQSQQKVQSQDNFGCCSMIGEIFCQSTILDISSYYQNLLAQG